jgi:cyanate lyase
MDRIEIKRTILEAKEKKKLSWTELAEKIGMSPIWTVSVCFGNNSAGEKEANKICEILELPVEVAKNLQKCPYRTWDKAIPTDPLIYRLYEIVGVYGEAIKEVIHEKFGDGIMSAIDFMADIEKVEDEKGDRVVLKLNGKFLPYKRW